MCRFDFFFGCYSDNLARALQAPNFSASDAGSKFSRRVMQAPNLSASDGQNMVSMTKSALQCLRNEKIFIPFYEEVVEKVRQVNIDDSVLPRKCKIPRKLDDGTSAHTFSSCADMYRKYFYKALDLLLA
jgi:hypothetical protein